MHFSEAPWPGMGHVRPAFTLGPLAKHNVLPWAVSAETGHLFPIHTNQPYRLAEFPRAACSTCPQPGGPGTEVCDKNLLATWIYWPRLGFQLASPS